jgi:outer membrane receptor protein involved in Fe transport
MARFTLLLFLMLGSFVTVFAQSSTSLQGTVTDEKGEPVMFANVALKKNGTLVTGAQTDFDGKYSFNDIEAGTYDVEVSYVGYQTKTTADVVVLAGRTLTFNVSISQGIDIEEVVVIWVRPLVEQDNTTQGTVVTAKDIDKLAVKNVGDIVGQTVGTSSNGDGNISIRGSRSNATDYYIDGIRVSGSLLPQSEIEQLQVITGGLPASIGDITGGVISITTKGPSNKFSGTAELETSEFLDGYQYNLGMLSLSGPLLRKKDKNGNRTGESIIGYRFSGQYRSRGDRNPSAEGVYKVKDDVYNELSENPLVLLPSGNRFITFPAAGFLTDDDVELVKARPNSGDVRYDATARIDARLNDNMDIGFGGSFNTRQTNPSDQDAPNGRTLPALLNYNRNRTDLDTDARGFFRFRHRIGGATTAADATKATGTTIQNASYTLQFSYNYNVSERQDPIHQQNLFNYGYIGQFLTQEAPFIGPESDGQGGFNVVHLANTYELTDYIPSDINAPLANYNKLITDFNNRNAFPYFNGNRPGPVMDVYGLHANVNDIFNRYDISEDHRYQFNAKGLFEVVPGGNAKAKHTIEFGIMYEQRVERFYAINPRDLWTIGRQLTNNHFDGLNRLDTIGFVDGGNGSLIALHPNLPSLDGQAFFDRNLRNALGAGSAEWIDIDALTPDQLKLEYFSATELTNAQLIGFYGYDHLGNKLDGSVSFNDFFLEKDADGTYLRRIAPNQPIYTAAYIEDKFTFKDIIFRIGLRVDRYDANTKTLKDNYSLYDAFSAGELGGAPGTVSDEAMVYTSNGEPNGAVTAYRDGNTWYTADGTQVNSPINIFGVDRALPALVKQGDNIQSPDYDPNSSFVDAEPSITWMPRLSFSFPISDEANFFAHYDVLAQRPSSNSLTTPLTYYYFLDNIQTSGYRFNNPSLRPERTVDYEVGFQQLLTEASAIKISAYYKELRDMIQTQPYLYAYPSAYTGFGNQDFGTVKGFNFSYELRRTGNVSMNVSYMLQFAEGTGSDANSQRNISSRGNLRVVYPLSFDERHRITANLDYRYGEGKTYNGPTIAGKEIFANAGLNLTVISASGRPYTATTLPEILGGSNTRGGLNGSRLPWNTTLNLRIDKDFALVKPTDENGKKAMFLNVYLRVQNLLDERNVRGVYSATGSPTDDGYLASPRGQATLSQAIDPAAYFTSYQWALLNPDFFALPRQIFVGALVNF